MSNLFKIENRDLLNLHKFYRRAPKQFNNAAAMVLNDFAFGNRRESLKIINSKMTIRSDKFIESKIRVKMARRSAPISINQAEFGSYSGKRFSGLVEQETGEPSEKSRTATLFGRSGNLKKKIPGPFRLKKRYPDQREFEGKNSAHRIVVMLKELEKKNFKSPFIVKHQRKRFKRGGKMPSGLYKFKTDKKLILLQKFSKKRIEPRRIKWLSDGTNQYFKKNNPRDVWAKSIKRTLDFK